MTSSKPRILIFTLAYFPFVGGAEVAVRELISRLPQFEFEIITANVKNFWSKYSFPFWASRRARLLHQERPFNLVWSIMANQAGIAGAWFKGRYPKVPFLLTLQEGDDLNSFAYRVRLLAPRLARVFQHADHIQAISHYLASWARQMGATCPVEIIPNGVNSEYFPFQQSMSSSTTKVVVHHGRLVPKNGLDDLVRALTFLPQDVTLHLIGTGPQEGELRALAASSGMASRVSFLGYMESLEAGQYLPRASVFCRPSRSEGLGNSFLEAMAVGVPVVGTPIGGIPDFLKHGETGWLCRVGDPQSIAEQIGYILAPENAAHVHQVVSRARAMVVRDYTWDNIAKRFGSLLESML